MATLASGSLTAFDIARRLDPDGSVATIIELTKEENELLEDAVFVECNDGSNHKTTVRTGLPQVTWRKLYGGVPNSKSTTKQVSDTTGSAETLAKTDVDQYADTPAGDQRAALRLSEEAPHVEALMQDVTETTFYGDVGVDPEKFTGLAERYSILSTDNTLSGYNIFDAGGTTGGQQTSIWLVTWGPNTCHMLFPKGTQVGIKQEDKGEQMVQDENGDDYFAFVTRWVWKVGLALRDWRSVSRIANIDVPALELNTSPAELINLMIRASERVRGMGKKVWYMHERVKSMLRIQKVEHGSHHTSFVMIEGKEIMMFDSIPVRKIDQLLLTEARIV